MKDKEWLGKKEAQVLFYLEEEVRPYVRELANGIASDTPYTVEIVNGLEEDGLVKRSKGSQDNRRSFVELTDAGGMVASKAQSLREDLKRVR